MALTHCSMHEFKEQGVSMRTKLLVAIIVVFMTMPMFQAMGQILRDPNIPDTVRLGCPVYKDSILVGGVMQLPIGDSIQMPVYLFNDELISGMSLGFIMDTSRVKFLSFRFAPSILDLGWSPNRSIKDYWLKSDNTTRDSSKQSLIFGGADFSGAYTGSIPAVTGSGAQFLGTISLLIRAESKAGWYNLDSAQIGGAGFFVITGVFLSNGTDVDSSFSISPQFKHCAKIDTSADIYLPVQEEGSSILPTAYSLKQNSPNPFNPIPLLSLRFRNRDKLRSRSSTFWVRRSRPWSMSISKSGTSASTGTEPMTKENR
jgi:hypothetical protein